MESNGLVTLLQGRSLREVLAALQDFGETFLVYDEAVAPFAGELSGLPSLRGMLSVDTSEEAKSIETVLLICRNMLEADLSRKACLIALGGGILTDMAGFAASIYKRGIAYVNIPTTLLAQVDAAIGGKTGVNFAAYKNMLGVIVQPRFTYLCPEVLGTLPRRDFLSGAAELLKTFLIDNRSDAYARSVALLQAYQQGKDRPQLLDEMQPLIYAAAQVKADIVARDPYEQGERKKLNLGHSFAHAMEHEALLRGDSLTHGEAVARGMILAAELSERLHLSALSGELRNDFARAGLPTDCPYAPQQLRDALYRDKKTVGERIDFVLLRGIGDVIVRPLAIAEI